MRYRVRSADCTGMAGIRGMCFETIDNKGIAGEFDVVNRRPDQEYERLLCGA